MIRREEFDAALQKKPFVPFRIVTTKGKTYEVTERDRPHINLAFNTTYAMIGMRARFSDESCDRFERVPYEMIARLEPIMRMQATVGPNDVFAAMKAKPFVPFRIVTTGGRTYSVTERDPRGVAVGKNYLLIGVRTEEADEIYDHCDRVAYEKIARIEPMTA